MSTFKGSKQTKSTATCAICHKTKQLSQLMPCEQIREPISSFLLKCYPQLTLRAYVCIEDITEGRILYLHSLLKDDFSELTAIDPDLLKSMGEDDVYSRNANLEYEHQLTIGDRLADMIAEFGGSWKFIILFLGIMAIWITLNSVQLFYKDFDPYPYILLNLLLSCIAALQAPVIMMSQNRQEDRDRVHAEVDYRVNLKAELEIRQLNAKVDELLTSQWQRLLEIQQVQTEVLETIQSYMSKNQEDRD